MLNPAQSINQSRIGLGAQEILWG